MMVLSEMTQVQPRMKLATGLIVLAGAVGALGLWVSDTASAMVGVAVGLIVAALIFGVWRRNRQRRRLTAMRDSALW